MSFVYNTCNKINKKTKQGIELVKKAFARLHSRPLDHAAARNRRPRKTFGSRWHNFALLITCLYEFLYKQILLH